MKSLVDRMAGVDGPQRLHHGRDEEIIAPDVVIVDTQFHFYVTETLHYMLPELLRDVNGGHAVQATVYVSTRTMSRATGPENLRPLGEVEFANGVAAQSASGAFGPTNVCAGILGFADLTTGPQIADLLDRCLQTAPERFKGIRQTALEAANRDTFRFSLSSPPSGGVLGAPKLRHGLNELTRRGLTWDTSVFHTQLAEFAQVADAAPDATIVLDHMGIAHAAGMKPCERAEVFEQWRAALADVSRRPNVMCKIGGLGMPFWGLGFDERDEPYGSVELANAWRPYVETAFTTFGPDRCMLESNYPPDGRSTGYIPLWNAFKRIFSGCSVDERRAVFSETATRVYRLGEAIDASSRANDRSINDEH